MPIQPGPVYPTPSTPPFSVYPCCAGGPDGDGASGPRFGPALADALGAGAWPTMFGYQDTPTQLLSVPGYDSRSPVFQPSLSAPGVIPSGGYRGSSQASALAACRFPGFVSMPRWTGSPVGRSVASVPPQFGDGLITSSDFKTAALWIGAGLVVAAIAASGSRGGRRR
jgi:hypothetical protein